MKLSLAIRTLTVAGVALGSALLIGALALAMRGMSPVSSEAAVTPSTQKMLDAVQGLERSPHHLVRNLAAWHAPRVPKFHAAPPPAPRVMTITTPARVVQLPAAPAHTSTVQSPPQEEKKAPPPAHESESDDHGDSHESGGGDD